MATEARSGADMDGEVYERPREVSSLDDCYFYHVTEIPGHGVTDGEWDLRGRVDEYLGHVPLEGRRVLEIGTASGFLCFEMERRGAEVVAVDLDPERPHDIVPYGGQIDPDLERQMAEHVLGCNNAWWFCRREFGSRAQLVHASAYEIPEEIGAVDVCTFGSVLLHLHDPFGALASGLRLTRQTAIVTEFLGPRFSVRTLPRYLRARNPYALAQLASRMRIPASYFLPDHHTGEPKVAWWSMTPALIERMLGTLGFDTTSVSYTQGEYAGQPHRHYTVVAERARGQSQVG
jgi:SAM-dependent methyltransferase